MHARIPLSFNASLNLRASYPRSPSEDALFVAALEPVTLPLTSTASNDCIGFSDCGLVKRGWVMSIRGHGAFRGRIERLMMVFGGGSSPMSCVGCGTWPSHTLQRDQSTSVPSGLRSTLQTREHRSGDGLLCPLIVGFIFPERQHKYGDFAGRRDRRLAKTAPSGQSHGPAFQPRETFHLVDHA